MYNPKWIQSSQIGSKRGYSSIAWDPLGLFVLMLVSEDGKNWLRLLRFLWPKHGNILTLVRAHINKRLHGVSVSKKHSLYWGSCKRSTSQNQARFRLPAPLDLCSKPLKVSTDCDRCSNGSHRSGDWSLVADLHPTSIKSTDESERQQAKA